jgi:hypothetical protein
MPVQPVTPSVEPTPSIAEQLVEGFITVLKNYWALLIIVALVIGLGIAIYYWWKREQEDKQTTFEKLLEQAKNNARGQANPKRIQSNSFITYGIFGIAGAILGLLVVIFMGLIGVYFAPAVTFTMILLGGVFERIAYPFKKSDLVYMRYKKNDKIVEKYVGKYLGEFYSNDGFFYLLINRGRRRIILKEEWVVKIPQRYDLLTDMVKKKIDAEVFKNVLQFTENNIIINHAVSLEKQEAFYYPVFVSNQGEIIDNGLNYWYGDQRNAILQSNYAVLNESAKAMRQAIQMNPPVQYKQATSEDMIVDVNKKPYERQQ